MKKKRLCFAVFGTAFILLLSWWFAGHQRGEPAPDVVAVGTNSPIPATTPPRPRHGASLPVAATSAPNPTPNYEAAYEAGQQKMEEARQSALEEWRTPIEFYGKVVDEGSNAVPEAEVDFEANDTSVAGTSVYHTKSDAAGLFSISGIEGAVMGVKVSKEGYYSCEPVGLTFWYAPSRQNINPDVFNPVVFHLKKKGVADRLIRFSRDFVVPRDGSAVEVSLTTGQAVPSGQGDLRVRCWTDDAGKRPGQSYDWKCEITVPGGGLLPRVGSLDFQAPLNGYQGSDMIDMPASLGDQWVHDVKRNYFLKLADGNFARVSFEMVAAGDHFIQLESFLNPSGSPNLEYNPENYVHAGQ